MFDTLEVLGSSGHITVTWNPEDPAEVAKARAEVESLRAAGYSFFAVVGETEDPLAEGRGSLIVERVASPIKGDATPTPAPAIAPEPKKGRRNVAVRHMQGG